MQVEALVSYPAAFENVIDLRDVSPLLDAGINKKTPVSMSTLNCSGSNVG